LGIGMLNMLNIFHSLNIFYIHSLPTKRWLENRGLPLVLDK
jgi:hypothetical protein